MKYRVELTSGQVGFMLSSARAALEGTPDPDARIGLEDLVRKLEDAPPIPESEDEAQTALGVLKLQDVDENAMSPEDFRAHRQRLHNYGAGGCQAELDAGCRECINPQCGWRFRL